MNDRLCFPYEDDMHDIPEGMNELIQVYNKMYDKVSREIFTSRLLLSLTENYSYMKNVILHTDGGKKLNDIILSKRGVPQYIYGAGIRGKRLIELFPKNNWKGIIDRYKSQEKYRDVEIINLEQFLAVYRPGTAIFVSNMFETDNIVKSLLEKGIILEDIYALNILDKEGAKNIYFDSECIKPLIDKEEIFVDIGCYDGKDSINYMKWSNNNEVKIYAFEPDIKNYQICKKNLDIYSNIKLLNIGLSDQEQEVCVMGEGEMSYFGEGDGLRIYTNLLDNVIADNRVGFIKMDVEGHEANVLKGAESIIREQHPMLAISLYHKKSDIWRIPMLLLKFNSNYHFFMRYYGALSGDTVLYAVDC